MIELKIMGDDVLKRQSSLVPKVDKKVRDLIEAMFETMYEGKGLGLAAPQIGELKRLFICQIPDDQPRIFVNPEIVQTSEDQVLLEEGCLSIPGVYAEVLRPMQVTVQAWNEHGKPFTINADGLLSRVIQHELDHLNGVLFVDRLNEKKRQRILKTYTKKVSA